VDTFLLALRVVVSLAVVIGAIWFVQRRSTKSSGARSKSTKKPISVVARQSVGQKASIAVVDFGGKRFLLGVTEHGISVLHNGADETDGVQAIETETATTIMTSRPRSARGTQGTAREFGAVLSELAPAELEAPEIETTEFETLDAPAAAPVAASAPAPVEAPAPAATRSHRAHRAAKPTRSSRSRKATKPTKQASLSGSLLSADTWKQAYAAIRGGQ
jgi:flagellar protein FliO/FliZ